MCGKDGCGHAGGQAAGAITRFTHQDSLSQQQWRTYISQPGQHRAKFSPGDSAPLWCIPHPGLRTLAMHVNALFLLLVCGMVCAGPALTMHGSEGPHSTGESQDAGRAGMGREPVKKRQWPHEKAKPLGTDFRSGIIRDRVGGGKGGREETDHQRV